MSDRTAPSSPRQESSWHNVLVLAGATTTIDIPPPVTGVVMGLAATSSANVDGDGLTVTLSKAGVLIPDLSLALSVSGQTLAVASDDTATRRVVRDGAGPLRLVLQNTGTGNAQVCVRVDYLSAQ